MNIYELDKLSESLYSKVGGKAKGLGQLAKSGLNIARGFVVTDLKQDEDFENVYKYLADFTDKPVAVRSSANNEDGEDFSNAGQYSTYLNVTGRDEVIQALKGCINSLEGQNSDSYASFFGTAKSTEMNIVVQEMVDAECAGVCFTINPMNGKKELVLEAVKGLGESLVSGEAAAESLVVGYTLTDSNKKKIERSNLDNAEISVLTIDVAEKICIDALDSSEKFGYELDTEWAIDKDGVLYWLQARPVTTGGDVDLTELDSIVTNENHVYTTCNIGEMMPGAITPLTLSTSVMSIEKGLVKMLIAAGAYKRPEELPDGVLLPHFSNHLFFNLTYIYKMAYTIVGAAKRDVERSICGKELNTPDPEFKKKALLVRVKNMIKYFSFLFSRKKAMKKIDKLVERLEIPIGETPEEYYANIDRAMPQLIESAALHYRTSAHSGAMSSTLLTFIKEDISDETECKALVAGLLEDIDGIESVDILRSMRQIAKLAYGKDNTAAEKTPEELLEFILNDDGELKNSFDEFIKKHGHRSIKEAEMRSRSWDDDKLLLAENISAVIASGNFETVKPESKFDEYREKLLVPKKGMMKKGVDYIMNQARIGVYSREYTKSRYIRTIDYFKVAYKNLGEMLVGLNALPDADLIYFLSHEEIGELINDKKASLIKKAVQRRRIFPQQEAVSFNDVSIGHPSPIERQALSSEDGMVLTGSPISRGFVRGAARVVRTKEDAKELKKGEIMVASFTDIGWSPYYSLIGGLVTEVGSALSHGAVVAREYGLPLVVNVSNAVHIINTGDVIELDATAGTVTVISTANADKTILNDTETEHNVLTI